MFRNEEQLEAIHGAVDRMIKRAIALDGTCTGEHGVGIGKRAYLYDELGEGTVELMKAVKKTIDPLNIMNPGKVRLRRAMRHGAILITLYSCRSSTLIDRSRARSSGRGALFLRPLGLEEAQMALGDVSCVE